MGLQLFPTTFAYQFNKCSKIISVSPILTYQNSGDPKEAINNKSIGFLFLYFRCRTSLTQQLKDVGSSQAKFFKSLFNFYRILMSRGWQITWNNSIWIVTKVTNFFYKGCWTRNALSKRSANFAIPALFNVTIIKFRKKFLILIPR